MITLKHLSFEVSDAEKAIEYLKHQTVKPVKWPNFTYDEKSRVTGRFKKGFFRLNPIYQHLFTTQPSLIQVEGKYDPNSITINLRLSLWGVLFLIFNILFANLIFLSPSDRFGKTVFSLFIGLLLFHHLYLYFRDFRKTVKLSNELVNQAIERAKSGET